MKAEISLRRVACKSKASYRPKDVIEISDTEDSKDAEREKEINLLEVTDDEAVRLLRLFVDPTGPNQHEGSCLQEPPRKVKWNESTEQLKDSVHVQSSLARSERRRVESSSPESGAFCGLPPATSGSRVITRPTSSRVIFCNVRLH